MITPEGVALLGVIAISAFWLAGYTITTYTHSRRQRRQQHQADLERFRFMNQPPD